MGGKAKAQKHTAAEIKAKTFAATVNRGGGSGGAADRAGGKAGHAKYKCRICGQQAPDPKSCEAHWDSKHAKAGPFNIEEWSNMHEIIGATTTGVAVRGGAPDNKRGVHKPGMSGCSTI